MNVLVLAPHPDDEAIGCGGAVAAHADAGDRVHVAFVTSGELGLKHLPVEEAMGVREAEARAAAEVLGVAELSFLRQPDWGLEYDGARAGGLIGDLLAGGAFDRLYVPHPREWHPDHQAVCRIAVEAARRAQVPDATIFGYEIWTPIATADVVQDVGAVMDRKLEAIRCYPSQLAAFDYVQAATGLNRYRGALGARCDFAEAFQVAPFEAMS